MGYYESLDNAGISPVTITTARGRPLSQSIIIVGEDLTGETFDSHVVAYQGSETSLAELTITVSNVDTGVTYQSLINNSEELRLYNSSHIPTKKTAADTVDVSTLLITANEAMMDLITESNPIQGADTVLYWYATLDSSDYPFAAGMFKLTGA